MWIFHHFAAISEHRQRFGARKPRLLAAEYFQVWCLCGWCATSCAGSPVLATPANYFQGNLRKYNTKITFEDITNHSYFNTLFKIYPININYITKKVRKLNTTAIKSYINVLYIYVFNFVQAWKTLKRSVTKTTIHIL